MNGHGVACACSVHDRDGDLDDERTGKAIARAYEPDIDPAYIADCD